MRRNLTFSIALAALTVLGLTGSSTAEPGHNTANSISLQADHPDSFRQFAPELQETRDRAVTINTDVGLHLSEIAPGLFFVTDLVYQSAFMVTDAGVVVLDAPPSFGTGLRELIERSAPGVPITHLIMSHGHNDHNGGGQMLSDVAGLTVVAASGVAQTLQQNPLDGVLAPTQTFDGALDLSVGSTAIKLQETRYHAEDTDVMIYLPKQKFLMAVDTITPGEVPFMNFGATANVDAYFRSFDTFLAYDFEYFLSGHVSVLGSRQDVIAARDYAFDVRDTVYGLMPTFANRVAEALEAVAYQNGNLAYRYAIESIRNACAGQIIPRWESRLSVVDIWADSHCETTVVYAIMH